MVHPCELDVSEITQLDDASNVMAVTAASLARRKRQRWMIAGTNHLSFSVLQ